MTGILDTALYYVKAIAGLAAAVATSLLTIYGPDSDVGQVLTVAVAVAGAVAVYAVPNRTPAGERLVDPDGLAYTGEDDGAALDHGDDPPPGEHRREG